MQRTRYSGVVLFTALVTFTLAGSAGCASTYGPAPAGAASLRMHAVIVESSPEGATLYVNGEEKGLAPVLIRIPLDERGAVASDMEITVEWEGRSGSVYRIRQGESAPRNFAIGANGMVVR